jgi:hypothetical protein
MIRGRFMMRMMQHVSWSIHKYRRLAGKDIQFGSTDYHRRAFRKADSSHACAFVAKTNWLIDNSLTFIADISHIFSPRYGIFAY